MSDISNIGNLSLDTINAIVDQTGTSISQALISLTGHPRANATADLDRLASTIAILNRRAKWSAVGGKATKLKLEEIGKACEGNAFFKRISEASRIDPLVATPDATPLPEESRSPFGLSPRATQSTVANGYKRWATIADRYLNQLRLNTAEKDVLNTFERIIVHRKGWGKFDPSKEHRLHTPLDTKRLAAHGKHCGESTLRRAIARLTRLRLISFVGFGEGGRKLYAPNWDARMTADPTGVFAEAAERSKNGWDSTNYWRSNDQLRANDPTKVPDKQALQAIETYAASRPLD